MSKSHRNSGGDKNAAQGTQSSASPSTEGAVQKNAEGELQNQARQSYEKAEDNAGFRPSYDRQPDPAPVDPNAAVLNSNAADPHAASVDPAAAAITGNAVAGNQRAAAQAAAVGRAQEDERQRRAAEERQADAQKNFEAPVNRNLQFEGYTIDGKPVEVLRKAEPGDPGFMLDALLVKIDGKEQVVARSRVNGPGAPATPSPTNPDPTKPVG